MFEKNIRWAPSTKPAYFNTMAVFPLAQQGRGAVQDFIPRAEEWRPTILIPNRLPSGDQQTEQAPYVQRSLGDVGCYENVQQCSPELSSPFTPKSDQFQIYPRTSLEILTSRSMRNLAFHSLEMKDGYIANSHYPSYTFLFGWIGECAFWTWGLKGWSRPSDWQPGALSQRGRPGGELLSAVQLILFAFVRAIVSRVRSVEIPHITRTSRWKQTRLQKGVAPGFANFDLF